MSAPHAQRRDRTHLLVHALVATASVVLTGTMLFVVSGSIALQAGSERVDAMMDWFGVGLPWLMLLAAGWAVWKRLRYRVIFCGLSFSGSVLLYLAWDDFSRPPAPKLDAVVADNSPSYTAYRWLVKNDPHSRLPAAKTPAPALPVFPQDSAEWAAFVTSHRAEFENAWASDELGRAWVDAMAANVPEGIFPPPGVKDGTLDFSTLRRSCSARWGAAHLLLLERKPDDAARLLLPLLQASYHLQRGGTSLVVQMIAMVMTKGTYSRLELIIDKELSATTRAEIAQIVREAPPMKSNIENAFLGERSMARSSAELMKNDYSELAKAVVAMNAMDGYLRDGSSLGNRFTARFFFNPNRTEREYAAFLDQVCALVVRRELVEGEKTAHAFEAKFDRWRLKNPVGRTLIRIALPAFAKVSAHWWKIEDQRLQLLARLEAR